MNPINRIWLQITEDSIPPKVFPIKLETSEVIFLKILWSNKFYKYRTKQSFKKFFLFWF